MDINIPVLFDKYENCCGCGSCFQKCPVGAIKMTESENGFLIPLINPNICVGCKTCVKSCPIHRHETIQFQTLSFSPIVFAARHKDRAVLEKSSSGGAFTAIVQALRPDFVFGAVFDENYNVVHASKPFSNFSEFRGSKYVQSNTGKTFIEAKRYLDLDKTVLYIGTPCQIAGLKAFLNYEYDNLFTCDLICEGVQSQHFFNDFLYDISNKGKKNIKTIEFRNKKTDGWEYSSLLINFESGRPYRVQCHSTDSFYMAGMMFLGGCRDSCYNCKFNGLPRQGDFTIGDLWGWRNIVPTWNDNRGISLIMLNTSKALLRFDGISNYMEIKEISLSEAVKKNPNIIQSTKKPFIREQYMKDQCYLTYCDLKKKYHKPRSKSRRFLSRIKHKFFK